MEKRVFLAADIKRMDAEEIARRNNELELIRKSGAHVAAAIRELQPQGRMIFFCGPGNNGADGIAAALELAQEQREVLVFLVGGGLKPNALMLWGEFLGKYANSAFQIVAVEDLKAYEQRMECADLVVDALLGTGARFGLKSIYREAAQCINRLAEHAYVLAVDVPTGVCADTGRVDKAAVRADETICLTGYKPGHILFPGTEYAGRLSVAEVLENPTLPRIERRLFLASDVEPIVRPRNSHKGDYGRLALIVGSMRMPGAGLLCTQAALRSGAGMVSVGTTYETAQVYAHRVLEAMVFPLMLRSDMAPTPGAVHAFLQGKTAAVMGPGLGTDAWVYDAVCATLQAPIPKVLDADALNALAEHGTQVLTEAGGLCVLTPHPAELARLLSVQTAEITADPLRAAETAATKFGCTVLLKGAATIVTDGARTNFIRAGCSGMAKGGSGDVLSGVIGALLAQGNTPFYAASAGAYFCGKAGQVAMERLGATYMQPSDTIAALSEIYRRFEE